MKQGTASVDCSRSFRWCFSTQIALHLAVDYITPIKSGAKHRPGSYKSLNEFEDIEKIKWKESSCNPLFQHTHEK